MNSKSNKPSTPAKPEAQPFDLAAFKEEILLEAKKQAKADLLAAGFTAPVEVEEVEPVFYDTKPPAEGSMRIRIRTFQGRATTPKFRVVDDAVYKTDDELAHNFVFPGDVLDIPADVLKDKATARGLKRALGSLIEECPSTPATRPFRFDSIAEARAHDPRFSHLSASEIAADEDRIKMSVKRRRDAAESVSTP